MEHQNAILDTGAHLVVIGNGTPEMAQDFVEQFHVRVPVYTDPQRESYRRAGMKRSMGLGLRTPRQARRAMAAGHRQGKVAGDPWQQGGVLVVDSGGTLLWRHVNRDAGDHASIPRLMSVLSRPA